MKTTPALVVGVAALAGAGALWLLRPRWRVRKNVAPVDWAKVFPAFAESMGRAGAPSAILVVEPTEAGASPASVRVRAQGLRAVGGEVRAIVVGAYDVAGLPPWIKVGAAIEYEAGDVLGFV